MLGKLFLKSLQVDAERVFASQIVHAEKVIDALHGTQVRQQLRTDSKVLPLNVPRALSWAHLADWLRDELAGYLICLDHEEGVVFIGDRVVGRRGQNTAPVKFVEGNPSENIVPAV